MWRNARSQTGERWRPIRSRYRKDAPNWKRRDVLSVENTDAGLHLVTFVPDTVDDRAVTRKAAALGLFPIPLSTLYATDRSRAGLILGFGGSDETVLAAGVETLAGLVRDAL
jgi:GntR family transcriptional regulator/MocR family aminotransferase